MSFDLASAQPVEEPPKRYRWQDAPIVEDTPAPKKPGFDLASAQPVEDDSESQPRWMSAPIVSDGEADSQPSTAAVWGSAIVRPIAKGIAALPLMAMDAGVAARNIGGDIANRALGRPATPDYELPSTMFNQALDAYTLKPAPGIGQAAEDVSSTLVGARVTPEIPAKVSTITPEARAARAAGYVLPPTQARPTLLNDLIEGVSGKVKVAQAASLKNQKVTNDLVRQALGIKSGAPITTDVLSAIRKQAGQAYQAVEQVGPISTDGTFNSTISDIGRRYAVSTRAFGRASENPVTELVNRLSKVKSFTGAEALNETQLLREDADRAAASRDKGLATALRKAASAIEDQIDRHLVGTNQPAPLVRNFRQARQLIAKTYSVQAALDRSTGDVSAQKLAAQLARDKPLSGGLRTAAEFGTAFRKAAQAPAQVGSVTHFSPLDVGVGGVELAAGILGHRPGAGAALAAGTQLARPLLRLGLLSGPGQTLALEGAPAMTAAAKRLTLAGLAQENEDDSP